MIFTAQSVTTFLISSLTDAKEPASRVDRACPRGPAGVRREAPVRPGQQPGPVHPGGGGPRCRSGVPLRPEVDQQPQAAAEPVRVSGFGRGCPAGSMRLCD